MIAVLLEPFAPALALGIGVSRAAASRRSKASPAVPAEVASFAWRASIAAGAEASPTATAVAPAATSSARVAAARAAEAASSCAVAAGVATRRFLLRRVYFPEQPSAEWFAVDLLRHHEMAGVPLSDLLHGLVLALRERRWDGNKLHELAETYGTKTTLACVDKCIAEARAA